MEIEGGRMRLRRGYLSSEEENNFMMLAALSISMSSKSERGNYIELLENPFFGVKCVEELSVRLDLLA